MTKPKLLLIDDDKNTLDGMVKILTRDGFSVCGVVSVYEALRLLSGEKFDIVITDMKLPGMGGLSLIHEVKKMEDPIAIVVTTAYGSEKTADDATQCGADYYLTKPVNIVQLESILEKLWDRQRLVTQNTVVKEKAAEECNLSAINEKREAISRQADNERR